MVGIEAEAAMLGQPVSMVIPEVSGFKLMGDLPEGATCGIFPVDRPHARAHRAGRILEKPDMGIEGDLRVRLGQLLAAQAHGTQDL